MKLTDDQVLAMNHFQGPALTLAIPGSGKTTLLIHRIAHLKNSHGVSPHAILTLTFSKASATDMERRFNHFFGDDNKTNNNFMTIHRFAYQIYQQYLSHTQKSMTLLEDGKKKFAILSEIFKKNQGTLPTEDQYEILSSHIGLIYNMRISKDEVDQYDFQWDNTLQMAKDFHLYKRDNNLYDFDDMLFEAYRILKANPDHLDRIRRKYPFIQVDEAQDTSKLQFELIELLLDTHQNLFVVADDDQSIYGFRGAFPQYLLNFSSKYTHAKLYYLTQNFRSDANIVAAASSVIQLNKQRYEKKMLPVHPPIRPVEVLQFSDIIERNRYILQSIEENNNNKAILYRNKISSLCLIDALHRSAVPFQIKDFPTSELKHWLLADLIAFFNLAMVPQDVTSFNKIAYKLNAYISKEMKEYVNHNQRGRSVMDVLVDIPFLEDYQTRTQETLKDRFTALQNLRPYDAIHFIEVDLGYLAHLKENSKRLGTTMHHVRTRLDAYKAIARPLKTLFEFIERIHTLQLTIESSTNAASESVTLSTLHGSKGLEFDEVYMIDVNPQVFPGFETLEKNALLEEERRLFYVGLTRAKKKFELLHVSFLNGSNNGHSKFIDELLSQSVSNHRIYNSTAKTSRS